MRVAFRHALGLAVLGLAVVSAATGARAADLTIAAANSTCVAIKKAGAAFAEHQPVTLDYICKSSGRLAKGLAGGAIAADFYISANKAWMDRAVDAALVDAANIRSLWGNVLVVASPRDSGLELATLDDLTAPGVEKILIGDPSTAPFGRYAKQAMNNAGVWETIKPKIATKKHITLLAESLAKADGSSVGILFSTNLRPDLKALVKVPGDLHDPIRYYAAPLKKGPGDDALVARFMAFLEGPEGQRSFREEGFDVQP